MQTSLHFMGLVRLRSAKGLNIHYKAMRGWFENFTNLVALTNKQTNKQTNMAFHICMSVFFLCALSQAFQYPAGVRRLAESDFKMLQGEQRKDSVLLRYRLGLHAVCGQHQEGTTGLYKMISFF